MAACVAQLALSSAEAQTTFISIGKSRVHPTRIIGRFSSRAVPENADVRLQSLGMAVQRRYQLVPGLVSLDSSPGGVQTMSTGAASEVEELLARIERLERSGLFEYVQPSYIYTNLLVPTDARFTDGTLWGLRNTGFGGGVPGADIGAVKAWDLTTGSTNVIVAVVDTGIRYTHQELRGQMWLNPGEIPGNRLDDDKDGYVDNVYGINAAARSGDPNDDNGHGTHVSGTIGAAANDGYPHVGVVWNVRLMACKFLEADGFGDSQDAIACIEFAVQHGARIINASWAGGPYERALLDTLTAARRAGVLFVTAAGNDSENNDLHPVYPAGYRLDNIVSVTSMDRYDRLSWFSNYGRSTVHLAAPGEDIFSSTGDSDNSYDTYSGTSMAAPHVAGVAALILAKFPNASVPELRERLFSGAVRVPSLAGKVLTGGRVNAYGALSAAPDGTLEFGFDPPEASELSARRPVPFFVTVTDVAGVTNATVSATVQGTSDPVVFHNDGSAPDSVALDEVYSAELTLPTVPGAFQIVFNISAPGKTAVTRTNTYVIAAPPLNDNFADALEIPPEGTSLQWTNRFATIEPGEPKHAQSVSVAASVWWNWSPRTSGRVVVDTAGSDFDTVLGVYTNTALANLKEIASADDAGSRKQGYATFDARSGLTYHIAVAGFSAGDAGTIRLRVEPGGGPDTNAPDLEITAPATGLAVTNVSDPKITVSGTAQDPPPNSSGLRQVQVQVNREVAETASGTTNWSTTVVLHEGQNRIRAIATDYSGNASRTRSVTVTYQPFSSPNDLLANAIELQGTNGTVIGNNLRASRESGEPDHAGKPGGKSIWWVYRPGQDGVLSLSTEGSSFSTLLAVYTGSTPSVTNLQALASAADASSGDNFSSLRQPMKAGKTYYIAVDGLNGAAGTVQLEYSFRAAAVYTLSVSSGEGGSVTPTGGVFEARSLVTVTASPAPFYWFDHWEGSVSSMENPLPVLMTHDITLVPHFSAVEFSDGFETGDFRTLPWRTSGDANWSVQGSVVDAGKFAARSGAIGSGQRTSLSLTSVLRAGTAGFAARVSSEQIWDKLEFLLNGKRLSQWSGEVEWTNFQFTVPAGTNTLEWRYSKDFLNTSAGLDAAFIDNLDLPVLVPLNASTAAHLSIDRFSTGGFLVSLSGQTNQLYLIQSSSDLKSWTTVTTNTASGGGIRFLDAPQAGVGTLFYRAVVP